MKITGIETIALDIPFSHGGAPYGWGGQEWKILSTLLVRVETDAGIVGYGDAFAYNCRHAVQAVVDRIIAPVAIGHDAGDIAGLSHTLQKAMHLFGRYGVTIFALSGLDIALWDIAGKAAGLPLHRLLGGAARDSVDGYASLFHYRDADIVAEKCRAALDEGFTRIKLHEIAEPEVRAAREAIGSGIPLMVDTNCPWTPAQAREAAHILKSYDLYWLEEPIFPPEDYSALAQLRRESGVPIAAGENACTAFDFRAMFAAGAVDYAQPSVTKVGGVTEFRKVVAQAEASGVTVMPHSPYFGPGFVATLHLMAAQAAEGLVERFYLSPEATLYGDLIEPTNGGFRVPEGPGLGADPDQAVIDRYRVA
ncbi:MAG: mandelate racemase/muconate lactonizing enzyme family protein [Alphaproteobacteria bacterium]|nr:mandelate racemase/muconate lactonizing enzyme family protein [Alphaproteobacteria bacterium]